MKDDVAELVYPVIKYGLDVKDRLDAGESVDIPTTHLGLTRLLADRRWSRLDGDGSAVSTSQGGAMYRSEGHRTYGGFLGVRYALVCWLDELFISHSYWGNDWRDHALEVERYKSNTGASQFWEQAQKAEGQSGTDALEVYYLCVMLGFRGMHRDQPTELYEWVERIRPQVIRGYGAEPPQRDNSEPDNYVPLLRGRDQFTLMFRWWWFAVSVLLFILVIFAVKTFVRG